MSMKYASRKGNWVPNEPVREAVQEAMDAGETLTSICKRLGWMRRYGANDSEGGDVTRLKRRLGVAPTGGILTETIRRDIADDILNAVGYDTVRTHDQGREREPSV